MRCLGRIRGEMVSVMTTHLPSTLVAHAGGKLCEHLTATQARYLASISSCGLRPNPPLTPQGLSHHVGSPGPDGVTTFHTHEMRPGWVPPVSRGRRYSPGR